VKSSPLIFEADARRIGGSSAERWPGAMRAWNPVRPTWWRMRVVDFTSIFNMLSIFPAAEKSRG